MCTVSWLPERDGYTLCFNRDERLTRAPALAPAPRVAEGMRFLAPLDGDHGGTWLAVNAGGLTLGMLNRYRIPGYQAPLLPRSRGLLLLDLIPAADVEQALRRLAALALAPVQPFTLVLLQPGHPASLAEWDGVRLRQEAHSAAGLIRTSSSVTEPEVAEARTQCFSEAGPLDRERLAALHRSHWPERGKRSICMHREDAETQSYSQVSVTPVAVSLLYLADAPCRATPLPLLTLSRDALHPAA